MHDHTSNTNTSNSANISSITVSSRLRLLALTLFAAATALACGSDLVNYTDSGDIAQYNAYWNCPTPSPVPTSCVPQPGPPGPPVPTPGPGTPTTTPEWSCTKPLPTATAYGRQMLPGGKTTTLFYTDQQVRIGPLRMQLKRYSTVSDPQGPQSPQPSTPSAPKGVKMAAHVWEFDLLNEGTHPLTITLPLRTLVREVDTGDGRVLTGSWAYSEWAGQRAGAVWDPQWSVLQGGQGRLVRLAVEAPAGRALAIGFAPDMTNTEGRYDAGQAANLVWFKPQADPYCHGNTSGPVTRGDQGGAVWQHSMPTPPNKPDVPVPAGRFEGWPVARGTYISQDFGCTSFPEISGYNCPPGRPWFHAGVDFAATKGSALYSVMQGRVTYVGVSQGVTCHFPGAEEPRTNLGWVIEIQSGPYTIKYGHTIVNSQRVHAGEQVAPGQLIGQMGSTGCSTGPHLHFQVQQPTGGGGVTFIDPFNLITVDGGRR